MNWLSRLIGREPPPNPENFERVRCRTCSGTGLVARYNPNAMHRCWRCHGKGYVMVARAAEELSDATVQSQTATTQDDEAREVSAAAVDEQSGATDLPDAPSAPTAPSPPRSVDGV